MKLEAKARLLSSTITDADGNLVEPVPRVSDLTTGSKVSALERKTVASVEDPVADGVAFETLIDGLPTDEEPVVQELTHSDGGIEEAPEQDLLQDDIGTLGITSSAGEKTAKVQFTYTDKDGNTASASMQVPNVTDTSHARHIFDTKTSKRESFATKYKNAKVSRVTMV